MAKKGKDLETGNSGPTIDDDQVETTTRMSAPAASRFDTNRNVGLDDGDDMARSDDAVAAAAVVHPIPTDASSFLPPNTAGDEPSVALFVDEVQAIHISSTLMRHEQLQELEDRLADAERANAELLLANEEAEKRRRIIQDRLAESERANAALLLAKVAAKKRRRRILAVVLSLALLGGGGLAGWQLGSLGNKGANTPMTGLSMAAPVAVSHAAPVATPIASLVAAHSGTPSDIPSDTPSDVPSDTPSNTPSAAIVVPPFVIVVPVPIAKPVVAPVNGPFAVPLSFPLAAPAKAPAPAPIKKPVVAPVKRPVAAPAKAPIAAP
jgi:hypothetical protein